MKICVRFNVFETNSSSTHSVIIVEGAEEYEDFIQNKTYYIDYLNEELKREIGDVKFVSKEVLEGTNWYNVNYTPLSEEDFYNDEYELGNHCYYEDYLEFYEKDFCSEHCIYNYRTFTDVDGLEVDTTEYITKDGVPINVICKYGHD